METNETNAAPASIETEVAAIRAKRRRKFNPWWIIAPVLLVVGVAIGYFGRPLLNPGQTASGKPDVIDLLISQTKHFKGNANAPITMLEFSDFQCPFCARFATGVERQIEEAFVKTGIVRFGYQHFAFLGEESGWAAEASECAGEQNKFWEYHDLLFARHGGENLGAFAKDKLKGFAIELKLDVTKFNTCLDSGKFAAEIQSQGEFLGSLGIQSTPTFLINRQVVPGALPFEEFKKVIEAEQGKQK